MLLGELLGAGDDAVEERVSHVQHHHRDGPVDSGAQLPGSLVAHEPEFGDRIENPLTQGAGNHLGAVQDVADGPYGYPGALGDFLDGRHVGPVG